MKLKPIQDLTTLDDLKPLVGSKQLTVVKISINTIPTLLELLLLSANLNYQAKQILDNQSKCKKGLYADMYINKAIELIKIANNYENSYILNEEIDSIKKKFGIKILYK